MRSFSAVLLLVGVLFVSTRDAMGDETPPNPYGVAGWGVLDDLGMPADSLHYDWNNLRPDDLCQMCRPNHYYDVVGIPHRWWGYNQDTDEINDPVQFDQWVLDHPGKVWIIGNEPDLNSQDGLTKEQYAHMYKLYYDFIRSRDASAKFCIGAITGGSTTDSLNYTKGWYQDVLDFYESTYSEPMHIDIWNIHSYCGPSQIEDPNQPIQDFVTPFVNWCHTVDGGRYADAEVWITELPIGEWMGALSEEWIVWFAQRYLPRLEQAGIDRWFWFVSRDSGEWATVALVKSYGVSPIGQAYAALANGYPNAIPPVAPYVPDPTPACFLDDFSSGAISHPWMIKAGKWAIEDDVLRQSRKGFVWNGETCVLQYLYDDFDASLKMRVNDAPDLNNWAGFLFHAGSRFHWHSNSGYLLFLRSNGAIGLHNKDDGTIQEIPSAVADASQWQNIRVQMAGWHIKVWVNESLLIDYTDSNQRFSDGYTILQVHKTDSSYDDVYIETDCDSPTAICDSITRKLGTDGTLTVYADEIAGDSTAGGNCCSLSFVGIKRPTQPYTASVSFNEDDIATSPNIVYVRVEQDDGQGPVYCTGYVTVEAAPAAKPVLTGAVSRKTHIGAGDWDIDVGIGNIESRSNQLDAVGDPPNELKIIADFDPAVTLEIDLLGGSDVTTDNGTVSSVTNSTFNTQVNLAFPGVFSLGNPASTSLSTLCIRVIVGDYDDLGRVKNAGYINQLVNNLDRARADFDCSGRPNFTDFAKVKNASLINQTAPACPDPPIGP